MRGIRLGQRRCVILAALLLLIVKVGFDILLHYAAGAPNLAQEMVAVEAYTSMLFSSSSRNSTYHSTAENNSSEQRHIHDTVITPAYSSTARATSKYAYAFVIGGCNPEESGYRGFLYNIMVVAKLMNHVGSTADVVALFQMSNTSPATELPLDEVHALQQLGVRIKYIDKAKSESFYDTVLQKFRILRLTEYRRVLLLDGDVMPIGNLDYLFELSDGKKKPMLKENLVVSGIHEPANGGFFMLEPGLGRWEQVEKVIRQREQEAQIDKTGNTFDTVRGWGHKIEPPDEWVSRFRKGRDWTFHYAFSDQGLLYYYTKYLRQSVTIMHRQTVENWAADSSGGVFMEAAFQRPFWNHSRPLMRDLEACSKFLCDFVHFTGPKKPWLSKDGPPLGLTNETRRKTSLHLWWWTLMEVDEELSLGLNFTHWVSPSSPPLGLFASHTDVEARIVAGRNSTFKR